MRPVKVLIVFVLLFLDMNMAQVVDQKIILSIRKYFNEERTISENKNADVYTNIFAKSVLPLFLRSDFLKVRTQKKVFLIFQDVDKEEQNNCIIYKIFVNDSLFAFTYDDVVKKIKVYEIDNEFGYSKKTLNLLLNKEYDSIKKLMKKSTQTYISDYPVYFTSFRIENKYDGWHVIATFMDLSSIIYKIPGDYIKEEN